MSKNSLPLVGIAPPTPDYKDLDYSLYRYPAPTDIPLNNFASDPNPSGVTKAEIISRMRSQTNVALLTQLIVSRNSIGLPVDTLSVSSKIANTLDAWVGMGKFDTRHTFASIQLMTDYYNKEFIREFADVILPVDAIKVQSVTNPNGMYVQQTRTLSYKTKPVPFWERALYKRLEDRVRDIPMDESESHFYKFEKTGKKIPDAIRLGDVYERESPDFRMLPNY